MMWPRIPQISYLHQVVFRVSYNMTDDLGIKKYIKPIPPQLSAKVKGDFPSFLQKTDEERIQNLPEYIERMRGRTFYKTEKVDGTSATYFDHENVFGACSRNLELIEDSKNTYWQVARELGLEEILNGCLTRSRNSISGSRPRRRPAKSAVWKSASLTITNQTTSSPGPMVAVRLSRTVA